MTHCNRYPKCGCPASIGTKCGLPEGDLRIGVIEPEPIEIVFLKQVKERKAILRKLKSKKNFHS